MDDDDRNVRNSHSWFFCHNYYSLRLQRCCLFILVFFLVCTLLIGAATIMIIFLLKPKRPIFAFQSLRLDTLKFEEESYSNSSVVYVHSSSSKSKSVVYASSNVSLSLNAQNPNKVIGLRYRSARLSVLYEGVPIGSIEVPKFNQPPHSRNVSVKMQVVFDQVNVTDIKHSLSLPLDASSKKRLLQLRIVGDIVARVRLWHVTLPKIKVALDCQIAIDYRRFMFDIGIYSTKKKHKASLHHTSSPSSPSSPSFSKKCSFAVNI